MSREYRWKSRAIGAAHQLSNQLLVKQYWFQLPLCNKTVISCLFGRIVKTMPLGTVDSSMHNCLRPCGLGLKCIELSTAPRGIVLTIHQTGKNYDNCILVTGSMGTTVNITRYLPNEASMLHRIIALTALSNIGYQLFRKKVSNYISNRYDTIRYDILLKSHFCTNNDIYR